jgi:6-phosphogluconolactonase
MTQLSRLRRWGAITVVLAFATAVLATADAMAHSSPGAVYTLTNGAGGNAVKAFDRGADGTLTPAGDYATGGTGSGGGLGNQGAVVLDGKRLFAVNAGSDSISSFRVKHDRLELIDVEPSGGDQPISVTVDDEVLYVLNAGGAGNIAGFHASKKAKLSPLAGSTRPLSGGGVGPAQISFDPEGETLVVTEKNTNLIDLYEVDDDTGRTEGPRSQASAGATPFGFGFDWRDHLIVSEAFGGATDASAVSSYELDDGELEVITPSARTTETAACWIVVTDDGRYTYTTNTGSASITGYSIGRGGKLALLDADGRSATTGAGPIDMALSRESRFLYALSSGDDAIDVFRVEHDGGLTAAGSVPGLPDGATGLAAR